MSLVLRSNLLRDRPENRLRDALAQFEKDLSVEQQRTLQNYKLAAHSSPPDLTDVMQLTAQIDQEVSKKPGLRNRCFGPRFTNILQAVQQFASIGDVLVGGSQNLIACGVWSVVRFSLLVSTNQLRTLYRFLSSSIWSLPSYSPASSPALRECQNF